MIKEIYIDNLLYAMRVRRVGHTTLMLMGANNFDLPFSVVAHDHVWANEIAQTSGNVFAHPVGLNETEKLRGTRHPIIIDHVAIERIIVTYKEIIKDKDDEIGALKYSLDILANKIKEMKKE